jgi:hypothetical protein
MHSDEFHVASFPGSRPLTPPQPQPLRCTRRCPSGRRTRGSRCTPRSWKRRGRTRPRAARSASSSRTRRWRSRSGRRRARSSRRCVPAPKRTRSVGQDQKTCCCWTHAVGNRCHRTQKCTLLRCTFPARTPPPHRRARGVAAADRRGPQRLAGDVRTCLRALHGARARRLRPLARAGRRLRAAGE